MADRGPVIYPGPFAWEPFLLTDVQRMNLLQRCAIHTVGIGEANFTFLKELSAVGHGATVQIGKQ